MISQESALCCTHLYRKRFEFSQHGRISRRLHHFGWDWNNLPRQVLRLLHSEPAFPACSANKTGKPERADLPAE